MRVLQCEGTLTLLDEFSFDKFDDLLAKLPAVVLEKAECTLDLRWDRQVAERAIDLYAKGWVKQARYTNIAERKRLHSKILTKMTIETERQFSLQGY